jgi:hypothetical protein
MPHGPAGELNFAAEAGHADKGRIDECKPEGDGVGDEVADSFAGHKGYRIETDTRLRRFGRRNGSAFHCRIVRGGSPSGRLSAGCEQ